ncbi:MAG TPA: hypothetical protein PK006_12565 [Saprospiraceae bacterium]|nr:hypothetical protein [Saprospiraceae bacterium]
MAINSNPNKAMFLAPMQASFNKILMPFLRIAAQYRLLVLGHQES